MFGDRLEYDSTDALREIAAQRPPIVEGDAYGSHPDKDVTEFEPYRSSWWATDPETGDTELVGITSSLDKYFVPHEPGEIAALLADAADQLKDDYDIDFSVSGFDAVSQDYSQYTNLMTFDGVELNPGDDDPHTVQLRTTTANNGHRGTHYDIGVFRHTCGNRLDSVHSDAGYSQTHQESLDQALPVFAMRSLFEGVDEIEAKFETLQELAFETRWDAIEAIYDTGAPELGDLDYAETVAIFDAEAADPDNASLYEAGQTATNILSNEVPAGVPDSIQNTVYDRVADRFFDTGAGVPDPDDTAEAVITDRYTDLVDGEAEPYFDGEQQILEDRIDDLELRV